MGTFRASRRRTFVSSLTLGIVLAILAVTTVLAATFITNNTSTPPTALSPGWRFWVQSDTVFGEGVCVEVHPVGDGSNYIRVQCSFDNTGNPPSNWRCDVFTGGVPTAFLNKAVEYQFHIANFGTNCSNNTYLFTGFNWRFQTDASGVPLAVTLAEFYAVQQGDAVLVTWETASELNNRGFNLYRGTSPAGPDRQLNTTLIPSQSQGNPGGFVYTWTDRADLMPDTTYYYWLEDVDLSGATTMHGPVSVDFVVPTAVTLRSVQASPAAGAAVPVAGMLLALLAPLAGALAVRRHRA